MLPALAPFAAAALLALAPATAHATVLAPRIDDLPVQWLSLSPTAGHAGFKAARGDAPAPAATQAAFKPPTFGYEGARGPAMWMSLDATANAACGHGKTQSPVNFDTYASNATRGHAVLASKPDVRYADSRDALFRNLGNTVEVKAGGELQLDGNTWVLEQFHFHTPSEHRVDGVWYGVEMHLVHGLKSGSPISRTDRVPPPS